MILVMKGIEGAKLEAADEIIVAERMSYAAPASPVFR